MEQPLLPVVVVAGFLGSGKTTFVRHLLRDARARGSRAGVIVNEWGVASIDGRILSESGAQLMGELSGGCACCSSQEEMIWTLLELSELEAGKRPDLVILELSGLADPLTALDGLTVAVLLPRVRVAALVTLLDTARLEELCRPDGTPAPLLVRQCALADVLIANKSDLSLRGTPEQKEARLASTESLLRAFNATGHIEWARGGAIDTTPIWQRLEDPSSAHGAPGAGAAAHEHTATALVPTRIFERAALEAALGELGPGVWRAKGFVRLRGENDLFLVQYVGLGRAQWSIDRFEILSGRPAPRAEMVFIGPSVAAAALSARWSEATLPLV